MKREDVLRSTRLAGGIKRYHTWPVVQKQTVAEHTWQVLRIWWEIWGPMGPAVSSYLIWHDAGEGVPGDLPFPVKRNNPSLALEVHALEVEAIANMGIDLIGLHLTDTELVQAKLCDLIEMHEFGMMEGALGNTFAEPIISDTNVAIGQMMTKLPYDEAVKAKLYLERKQK